MQIYRDTRRERKGSERGCASGDVGPLPHPEGLQALYLPGFKTKERAQNQQQRRRWSTGQGPSIREAGSWSLCVADRQDMAAVFTTEGAAGRRRLPFVGGTDVRVAHWLQRKPVAGLGGKHMSTY